MPQRVLLTGANGFLGSHVLHELLENGSFVRSIVRSQAKADRLLSNFQQYGSQMEISIVEDFTVSGAFNSALKASPPFNIIIHIASPFMLRTNPKNEDILLPAIKGTTELLNAVNAHAPEVRRVVLTSSCAAVLDFARPLAEDPPKTYTEEDWNPVSYSTALTGDLGTAYQASKKFSELAAWDILKTGNSTFELVTLCPPNIYGPLKHPNALASLDDLNESNYGIYQDFINSNKDAPLPGDVVPWCVDVRDLAQIHLLAVTATEAANQRIIIPGIRASSQDICDILRHNFPELEARTPIGKPGKSSVPSNGFIIQGEKMSRIVPHTFRDMNQTFVDLGRQLLEIEKRTKEQ